MQVIGLWGAPSYLLGSWFADILSSDTAPSKRFALRMFTSLAAKSALEAFLT